MRVFAHYFLINPAFWLVALLILVATLSWKSRRWLSIVALVLLPLFFGTLPKWIIGQWEKDLQPLRFLQAGMEGLPILVLGAGSTVDERLSPVQQLHINARLRLIEGCRLWQLSPESSLVVSGSGRPGVISQAEVYAQAAVELGVESAKIETVPTPQTTFEEALHFKEKFPYHDKLILVTSSLHMRRAKKLFEKQGIEVVPSPHHLIVPKNPSRNLAQEFVPSIEGINLWSLVLHEWMGMLTLGW
ncbi:MAG: YdcF family protein [Lunatimonas sp.]|uniref:YdcF family protein n=1 Tax=Lunatimonas sp. TaxID=2060141 RepID=UPI00263A56DB|nr:YdcF family protein [Lunatimonas sp.]MCC5936998.1 YdcF family protein [Lunatimonas sp.]